jgi:hypothetical protein
MLVTAETDIVPPDIKRRWRSSAFVWWRWSALIAFGISCFELLCLILIAIISDPRVGDIFGGAEFSWFAAPFVAFALVAALIVHPLLILLWTFLARHIASLRSDRGWLVLFVLILCIPLIMNPRLYELAVAAPAVLGFLLPRFIIPQLAAIPGRGP